MAAVVVVAAAGYWWLNRPPGQYKPDNSGLYPINVNGKYGFMDRSGKTVITPQFDLAGVFSEGLANVRVGTKSGYINTKGVVAITPQFDDAGPFRFGRAGVKLGNRFGFIDKDGKYISSPDFSWAGQFSGDLAPVRTADGLMAFVTRSGKVELAGKVDSLMPGGFTTGLAPAGSGGKWGFIDATGKWIINPQFERAGNFAEGLAPVVVGGRTGYIDHKGKFVVNPQYDSGDEFYDGYASFTSGGEYGFIDKKGRVVSEPRFLAVGHFSDGLAPVKTGDGWGFINQTAKMAISPRFDSAEGFQNGLARVTVAGKEAYVTTAGMFVIDPFPVRAKNAKVLMKEDDKPTQTVRGTAKPPSWVPDYPGSDPKVAFTMQVPNGESGSFSFKTKDASDKVVQYYEDQFKSSSMKVTSKVTGQGGGRMLSAQDDTDKNNISIVIGVENSETSVAVTYLAKK